MCSGTYRNPRGSPRCLLLEIRKDRPAAPPARAGGITRLLKNGFAKSPPRALNSANLFAISVYHVDPSLQLALQFGDIHLVCDAISVADALHIAVLNHLFQTSHYGYAGQPQGVRDLTCANGRAHDGA